MSPLDVDCPKCRAPAGQKCRNYLGKGKAPCPDRGGKSNKRKTEEAEEGQGVIMKLIRDMTEPELRNFFSDLARMVEDALPPGPSAKGKCLFALIVTDTTGPGVGQYVSNVRRTDMIRMLRETADRLEQRQDIAR